ncbi:MAG: hypothetical protein V4805_02550 [Pseudomonadota bacterium]
MKFALSSLLIGSLLLTGCAASVKKTASDAPIKTTAESAQQITLNITGSTIATTSSDWEPLKSEWRAAMQTAASTIGAKFSTQEGSTQTETGPGTLVVVYVNDYRYISTGARYGFGVMTGNAFVDASVQLRDLKTGALLGERKYNTSSSAWEGAFAAMTGKQIQAISTEIADEIRVK